MNDVKRIINTGFWSDDKVMNEFTPEDKYFMLYLLTNPHTTQLGIYHLPLKYAALELGYSVESVKAFVDRFEHKYEVIKYCAETNEIAIKNYLRHSIVKGGKPVLDCLMKEESSVIDKSLVMYICQTLTCRDDLNNTVAEFVSNMCDKYKNKTFDDNEQIVDEPLPNRPAEKKEKHNNNETSFSKPAVEEIIGYLNLKADTKFRSSTQKTATLIGTRMKEGFTVDDFKTVIDKKVAEWKDDSKMCMYLRPETLFGTKFEGYLNQKLIQKGGKHFECESDREQNELYRSGFEWCE